MAAAVRACTCAIHTRSCAQEVHTNSQTHMHTHARALSRSLARTRSCLFPRTRGAHSLYDYTDLWQNVFLNLISWEECCAKRMLHAKKKIAPPPDQRLISARGYELQGGGDDAVRVSAHAPPGVPPAREGCLPGHYCQGHPAVGQDGERGKNIYIHVSIYIHQCNTPLPRAPAVGQDREQAAIYIV